jgi:mono/diheme cytochrome c family protein
MAATENASCGRKNPHEMWPECGINAAPMTAGALLPEQRFVCALLALALPICAAASPSTPRVFLQEHCYDCHGSEVQKAGLRLDTLREKLAEPRTAETWAEVYERVAAGEMPPPKRKVQPEPAERATFADGLKSELLKADRERRQGDGRAVLRRLNREEYQNTIRDLFGIDVDVKELLPEDGTAQGFDNNGEALSISSVLLERYLEAADVALDAVLVKGPAPEKRHWHLTLMPEKYKEGDFHFRGGVRVLPDETFVFFVSQPFQPLSLEQFRAPVEGRYRFRVRQYVYQSAGKPLATAWYVHARDSRARTGKLIGHFDTPPGEPTTIEFTEKIPKTCTIKPMPYRLGARNLPDTTGYPGPGLAVQYVDVEGPLVESWPPRGQQELLGDLQLEHGTLADAAKALRKLAPRAFRRTTKDEEVEPYLALVRTALEQKRPFEAALRDGIKAMLCAPDFLFLREPAGRLDDFALASRLSYFLWSSLPDEPLLADARAGRLAQAAVMHAQVERMLDDAKSARFVENFTGQWLGLRNIAATTPDKKLNPGFDDALQEAMVQETQRFFTEMLRGDLSVRNFIDSDFAMLNARIAELYGIKGATGWDFRKVLLPEGTHRGGVLGQAAILKITANGTSTSPVIRGNWILKNVLGQPVKPPPPNVPALEPDIRGATTIREQVANHRKNEQCAVCHDRMDPLGLALENFDVIGQWRTNYRVPEFETRDGQTKVRGYKPGAAVDATGTLPGGRSFADVDELKRLLLEKPDQIARCVAGKLLTYATGAGLSFSDKMAVEEIVKETSAQNHGLRTLVHAVVASEPFHTK